jgi:hypothetical protein
MQRRLIQRSTGTESFLAPNSVSLAQPMAAGAMPCTGMVVPAAWMLIYRLAYEQARVALAPSRFQKLVEPSRN